MAQGITRQQQQLIGAVGILVQGDLAYYFWEKRPHLAGFFLAGIIPNLVALDLVSLAPASLPAKRLTVSNETGPNVGLTQEQLGAAIVASTSSALTAITGGSGADAAVLAA